MRTIGHWIALGCLAGALVGCGEVATPVPASPTPVATAPAADSAAITVDVRGSITGLQPAQGQDPLTLTVEGLKEGDTRYPSAIVRVPADTPIFRLEGGAKVAITIDQLAVDQRIEAVFVGPVTRSLPPQARAGEIVVLP
ncbi:MAG TPA: hypothetical protein VGE07_00615 [Herpetosiphonaceae bacterium]